jgi:lysozyme
MILRRTSPEGVAVLHYFEECRLEAYPDPATGGHPWTIGWGHTGPDVKPGMRITQERADQIFAEWDLPGFERDVSSLVRVPITQLQFDALVSFSFNLGSDIDDDTIAEGLGDSALLRKLNGKDYAGAADEFPKWNRAAGRVMLGLRRRRAAERLLFLGTSAKDAIAFAKGIT